MKVLTRERAIQEHRKMWNWIADQYENHTNIFQSRQCIQELKTKYIITQTSYDQIMFSCFCCEYVFSHGRTCSNCPIDWGSSSVSNMCLFRDESHKLNLYGILQPRWFINMSEETILECSAIARQIANLPERDSDED